MMIVSGGPGVGSQMTLPLMPLPPPGSLVSGGSCLMGGVGVTGGVTGGGSIVGASSLNHHDVKIN